METATVTAFAPGRVNLVGDHTDHTGGRCLPVALTLGVTVAATTGGSSISLVSGGILPAAEVAIDVADPAGARPSWARYVAGVVAEVGPVTGLRGTVESTLPSGVGLSSSAALEVALALALGAGPDPVEVAQLCQRAEQRATGVPCGVLDQLASLCGVEGHALLLDCRALTVDPVPVPPEVALAVVHSGERRTLSDTPYATRVEECAAVERLIGPLREATIADVAAVDDAVLRRRARHVVTENARVLAARDALAAGDAHAFASIVSESHRSLRDDFESSSPVVDALVESLESTPGVLGARITGGGWGGCVVVATEPGVELAGATPVRAGAGAWVSRGDGPSAQRTPRG